MNKWILTKKNLLKLFIPLVVVLLAALISLLPRCYLVAECDGELLFEWPIRTGESFEVVFIHSLNLSPIKDVIQWTGYDMIVRKSVFKSFGAGVPIPADFPGSELIRVGSHYELVGIDKHMEHFTIMTQDVPDHRIFFNGREAPLLELVGSDKAVDITVKRVPLIACIKKYL